MTNRKILQGALLTHFSVFLRWARTFSAYCRKKINEL